MAELTSKQRAFLRSRAHPLKAVVQVGKEGVTDDLVAAVTEAFETRELLKARVLEAAPEDARATAAALAERVEDAHLVQVIGRTVVLYRKHPEKPELRLP